jgi:hypothetical protein
MCRLSARFGLHAQLVVQGDLSVIEIEFGSKICQEKKVKKIRDTYFGSEGTSTSLGGPSGTARISETERVGGGRGLIRLFL